MDMLFSGGGESLNLLLGNQNISLNCLTCEIFMRERRLVTFATGFQNYILPIQLRAKCEAERLKRLIKGTEVRKTITIQYLKMGNSHIFDICVLHRQILIHFFPPKTTQLQKMKC